MVEDEIKHKKAWHFATPETPQREVKGMDSRKRNRSKGIEEDKDKIRKKRGEKYTKHTTEKFMKNKMITVKEKARKNDSRE